MAVLVTLLECKSSLSMDRSPVRDGYPAHSHTGSRYQHYQLTAYFPNLALMIVPTTTRTPTLLQHPALLLHFGYERFHTDFI